MFFKAAKIPPCDPLFLRFLDPWYSPEERTRKGGATTRGDVLTIEEYRGRSVDDICALNEKGRLEVAHRVETMLKAARGDWPRYLAVSGEINLTWIEAFDRHYNRKRIKEVIDRSDPGDFSNDYLVICCEFGAVLGHVMMRECPRLRLLPDWPYWESAIFDPKSGSVVPVFHWAIKKMSDYGWDDGFTAKVKVCLDMMNR